MAYVIDRIFGEFNFVRHPVMIMGDYIGFFEKHYYKDSVTRGLWLALSLIGIVAASAYALMGLDLGWLEPILIAAIASTTIATKMLYQSVKEIITQPQKIQYLVSRDSTALSPSDINKAAIESYAENLSDGSIAPLFYLLLFGLPGAFIYKAINTLDSMVGYQNERYQNFGKFSARLDDVVNFIPARLTAVLIAVSSLKMQALSFHSYGKLHQSPNAGQPIAAMALVIGVKLGGPTVYFGELKQKAYFGNGKELIEASDINKALSLQPRIDFLIIMSLTIGVILKHLQS
ncbi:MAG TPA: cobalamin biosynthesis protein CobD [Trueperaceae bacterium]|nr:cobalamin biosynthesis protein CobD [Trueperaceae bacterium]